MKEHARPIRRRRRRQGTIRILREGHASVSMKLVLCLLAIANANICTTEALHNFEILGRISGFGNRIQECQSLRIPTFCEMSTRKSSDSCRGKEQYSQKDGMTKSDRHRPSKSPTNSPARLNKDIFRLRRKKNGAMLAQVKLEEGIKHMLLEADSAKAALDANDPVRVLMYPDEVSFNAILSSHASNSKKDWLAPQKAERLLRRMIELSKDYPHLQPTIFTYNAVLEAYAKSSSMRHTKRAKQSSFSILRLFQEMEAAAEIEPNTFTHNLVLTSNVQESTEWKALEGWALRYLEDPSSTSIVPDRNTYNQLLRCYADAGEAVKAEALLHSIIDLTRRQQEQYGENLKASRVWFNLVLKAMAASNNTNEDIDLSDKAERLLQRMYELHSEGYDKQIEPDASVYNHVLNVQSKYGKTEQAEELVNDLERKFRACESETKLRPDRVTFTTLMKGYASRQRWTTSSQQATKLAKNATAIFRRMQELSDEGCSKASPNEVTYNTLIRIWANVGTRDALIQATTLLYEMTNDPDVEPDGVTFTTLIYGWSKGVSHLANLPEAGYRAEELLLELEQLPPEKVRGDFKTTKAYNSVIIAWSKSGDPLAADRVEALLSQLEDKYFDGCLDARPDKSTFICMIDAYAKARIPDAEERCEALLQRMKHYQENLCFDDLKPDRSIYNAVLNAVAKSSQPTSVDKAEDILTMMQLSLEPDLQPDIVTYATVIDCHTKCGDGCSRAEELLRFVEGTYRGGNKFLEPNAVFYSAILQAWAKTATLSGANKAEELLRRNQALFEEGSKYAKPHGIMFNAVMDAIARSGDPRGGQRAEELLHEMEILYKAGDEDMKPTRRSFNAVILAYRNQGDSGAQVIHFLSQMEDLADAGRYEVMPDVVSYNCALSAMVDSEEDEQAVFRARDILKRMKLRNIIPDVRTYGPVIEAWLDHESDEARFVAETMLEDLERQVENIQQRPKSLRSGYEEQVLAIVNSYRGRRE